MIKTNEKNDEIVDENSNVDVDVERIENVMNSNQNVLKKKN